MKDDVYFPNPEDGPDVEFTQISDFLSVGINVMSGIAFGLGFISIAVGLVKMVLSQGDPKATQGSFNAIKWGIISVVISLLVFTIKTIVVRLVGVTGMENATPDF